MINNVNLNKELISRYLLSEEKGYATLYRKFSKRFPINNSPELLEKKDNYYVKAFVYTLYKNGKEKYLENFYTNLARSKIVKSKRLKKKFLGKNEFGGNFYTKRNLYLILGDKKELLENNEELTPFHELLHLCTTRFDDKKTIRLGIQINNFVVGLNEGYTELLTKRYFNNYANNSDVDVYPHFIWIAEMLEKIIGEDKMEEYYFSSNIEGLITELEKYISREKVYDFIEDTDLLFYSEEELFNYQKGFIYDNKEINNNIIDEYYDVNIELLNRVYNEILEINEKKEIDIEMKKRFIEKNNKKKEQFEKEEELYRDYFKEDYIKYIKRIGG